MMVVRSSVLACRSDHDGIQVFSVGVCRGDCDSGQVINSAVSRGNCGVVRP